MSAVRRLIEGTSPQVCSDALKILMVNKFLYPNGGSETYMLQLGEYLASKGCEVQYFGMEHEGRQVGNNVGAYTSPMDFHEESIVAKLSYSMRTVYSIEARTKIRRVLDDFSPDIIHLNNFNFQITPSILLEIKKWREAEGRSCKIIYTAHDYQLICPNHMLRNPNTQLNCEKCFGGHYSSCIKGKCIHGSVAKSVVGAIEGFYWSRRRVYSLIDMLICPSDFVKEKLDNDSVLKEKTVAIRNFISIPAERYTRTNGGYVLYFGRLVEEKGVRTLLEACKRLPGIPFVLAGDGPLLGEASKLKNVKCLGFVQGDDLWKVIANASFCVCPSEWYEVFGLAIGEALALGTPVIASNIGAIPESVKEGINGELIAPGDSEGLSNAIASLWNDRSRVERYGEEAKESERLTVDRYCDIIAHMISSQEEDSREEQ